MRFHLLEAIAMKSRRRGAAPARVGRPVLWMLAATVAVAAAAQDGAEVPRAWDGHPDLSGVWQAMGTAHWDIQPHGAGPGPAEYGALTATPPGLGVVAGGEIPYQEWALEKKRENFAHRWTRDPEAKCYLPGVPRATYMPFPFQILQGTDMIMIVYGFAEANRTIHMNKENPEPAPIDSWMGRSHGRWEGDTLVVEAAGFNGEAWLDRAGNFASSALRVEERYTPMGPNLIRYEATLEDPEVFTRPWQMSLLLYRRLEEDAQVLEFKCVEFSEELLYGHLRKG
ncbi:MAG: hypothetical protein R3190_08930, partial [Thermoanaerobaculia bacterium]|nr:hypothetical protein [Thermoanaerobaculia bacterium]